jgi:dGTPase
MIDYSKKITTDRELNEIKYLDGSIESDRGRILSAPAFRRLQKRTQVFALELNASIRTRLTHSLEVAQTARHISKSIFTKLREEGLDKYGLEEMENAFVSTSEMTSLLHDIGNPPFGHFAEQTINKWIEQNTLGILDLFEATSEKTKELKEIVTQDITNYDGNAQAIRVITKLQRLNLSYTQILAVLKYTRGAYETKPEEGNLNYLKKKPGFYYSEKEFIQKIQDALGVKHGHRFPLTYIMEAADDISYLTADLEDSVEKGILSLDKVYNLIKDECEKEGETYLLELIEDRYQKAQENEEPYQFSMFFTIFRASIVGSLVRHVVDIYIDNHEAIFDGSFNSALLEYDKESKYYKAIKILERISRKHIYENLDVQELELQGYSILNGLLNTYKPLLELTNKDFEDLLMDEKIDCFVAKRLIKRVSSKQIVAYQNDVKKLDKNSTEEYTIMEWYYRVRLIIDYISGMTDDFALHEYQILTAIK